MVALDKLLPAPPPKSVCLLDPFLTILFSEKSATSMDSGGDRPFSEVKKAKKHPPSHGKLASGPQIGDMYTFMNTLRDNTVGNYHINALTSYCLV